MCAAIVRELPNAVAAALPIIEYDRTEEVNAGRASTRVERAARERMYQIAAGETTAPFFGAVPSECLVPPPLLLARVTIF